jgi:hypothetical protein
MQEGKPKFEYHQITLKYVEACFKEKGLSIDQYNRRSKKTLKRSIDQSHRNGNNIVDLDNPKTSLNVANKGGRSLAWFQPELEILLQTALAMYPLQVSSRIFFPFSFLGVIRHQTKTSLAGIKKDESQDSQLSLLRKDFIRRPLERKEDHKPENCQMSSVWQSEGLERRDEADASRQGAALLVPRLLLSVFRAVAVLLAGPLFSFFNYRLFLEVSSMEALL